MSGLAVQKRVKGAGVCAGAAGARANSRSSSFPASHPATKAKTWGRGREDGEKRVFWQPEFANSSTLRIGDRALHRDPLLYGLE